MPLKAVMLTARNRPNPSSDADRFGKLDVAGRQDEILQVLQVMEPNLRSLSTIRMGPSFLIHGDVGLGRKIPVLYMGDGLSRLLSMALAIATNRDGLVVIDEIENGIHHSVMEDVWEAIFKASEVFNCQIVATTHSYECLEAAHRACSHGLFDSSGDLFSYVRLAGDNGSATANIFDCDLLGTALGAEMEVR